jgi:hypothetical protein
MILNFQRHSIQSQLLVETVASYSLVYFSSVFFIEDPTESILSDMLTIIFFWEAVRTCLITTTVL